MEHVERAGVTLRRQYFGISGLLALRGMWKQTLVDYTKSVSAKALNVVGLVNIQYAYDGKKIYVIEVNPRASRTVPILSKVTRVPMVKLAVAAMLGHKLQRQRLRYRPLQRS